MLVLSRKKGEKIILEGGICINILDLRGDQVRIGITAPSHIKIYREEIYTEIQEENIRALETPPALPDVDVLSSPPHEKD